MKFLSLHRGIPSVGIVQSHFAKGCGLILVREQPTKDEYKSAKHSLRRSDSYLFENGYEGFGDAIAEKQDDRFVKRGIMQAIEKGYKDEVNCGRLPDNICPCGVCKRIGKRPSLEHKKRLNQRLAELYDSGKHNDSELLRQMLALNSDDLRLLEELSPSKVSKGSNGGKEPTPGPTKASS